MNTIINNAAQRKFFNISENFYMMTVLIMLFASICCLGVALYKYIEIEEQKIQQPDLSYSQLQNNLDNKLELLKKGKVSAVTQKSGDDEHRQILQDILNNLAKFAIATGQVVPSENVSKNIYKKCMRFKEDIDIVILLEQLKNQSLQLVNDAQRVTKLDKMDYTYFTWSDFLDFYFSGVDSSINIQNLVITSQRKKMTENKDFSITMLYAAAATFGVFIIFTLSILFISIERNTYTTLQLQKVFSENIHDNQCNDEKKETDLSIKI